MQNYFIRKKKKLSTYTTGDKMSATYHSNLCFYDFQSWAFYAVLRHCAAGLLNKVVIEDQWSQTCQKLKAQFDSI